MYYISTKSNIMFGTCSKCGASIKNLVYIKNKIYGTTCAQTVLGINLPNNFSGDGLKYKNKLRLTKLEQENKFKQIVKLTKRGWNVNIYFTKAYFKAKNDWERDFINSCADYCGATILRYIKENYDFDNSKRQWNNDYMGSFPYRDFDLNKYFEKLSEKQSTILNRII